MAQLLVSCLVAVSLILTYHLWIHYQKNRLMHRLGCLPPKYYPHKDPLFGLDLVFKMINLISRHRDIIGVAEMHKEYGSTFQSTMLTKTMLYTIDPENIRAIYGRGKDWGVEPSRCGPMEPWCGRAFLTIDGKEWERSRALIRPVFAKQNVSDLTCFEEAFEKAVRTLPVDGSSIDLASFFTDLFLRTSAMFNLGRSLDDLPVEGGSETAVDAETFLQASHKIQKGLGIRFFLGRWSALLPSAKRNALIQITHRFIEHYIDRAISTAKRQQFSKKSPSDEKDESKMTSAGPKALVHCLLEQTQDRVEIRAHIMQGMFAAQDTTSVLLSNTFFLLSRHPDVWGRLRQEALEVEDRDVTVDILKSLKFMRNVLNEAFRMYPIFPLMGRVALRDTVLPKGGGINGASPMFAKAGIHLNSSIYALHRDPLVFGNDIESFNPDRWDTIKPEMWEFMPFGGGPRGCIGQQKALAEASFILLKMAQRYQRVESRDDREWVGVSKVSAANENGCKVALIAA